MAINVQGKQQGKLRIKMPKEEKKKNKVTNNIDGKQNRKSMNMKRIRVVLRKRKNMSQVQSLILTKMKKKKEKLFHHE